MTSIRGAKSLWNVNVFSTTARFAEKSACGLQMNECVWLRKQTRISKTRLCSVGGKKRDMKSACICPFWGHGLDFHRSGIWSTTIISRLLVHRFHQSDVVLSSQLWGTTLRSGIWTSQLPLVCAEVDQVGKTQRRSCLSSIKHNVAP